MKEYQVKKWKDAVATRGKLTTWIAPKYWYERDNYIPPDAQIEQNEIQKLQQQVKEKMPGFDLTVKFRYLLNEQGIVNPSTYEMCCWFNWHDLPYCRNTDTADDVDNWIAVFYGEEFLSLLELRDRCWDDEDLPWQEPSECWEEAVAPCSTGDCGSCQHCEM